MPEIPPFPDDVPTAPIAVISYSKLEADAPKVYEACRTDGFFYLDLTGEPIAAQADQLQELAAKAFDHPTDDKMKYELVKGQSLAGYKAPGARKLTDSTLRPDATEFFNIFTDHLHDFAPSRTYPPYLKDNSSPSSDSNWNLLRSFSQNAHQLCLQVLNVLSRQLSLPPESFTSRNVFGSPSGSHIRLTHKPPTPPDQATSVLGLPSHTDFGSITLLFTWLGGLQIQHPWNSPSSEWKYIRSLPHHAIINLGDAMVRFTNGELKSAKHRVVEAPGPQANVDRYSVVYFVRPGDDVEMRPLEEFLKGATTAENGDAADAEAEGKDGADGRKGKWKKVAGKFQEDGDRVLTAGEWMKERQKQMGS